MVLYEYDELNRIFIKMIRQKNFKYMYTRLNKIYRLWSKKEVREN